MTIWNHEECKRVREVCVSTIQYLFMRGINNTAQSLREHTLVRRSPFCNSTRGSLFYIVRALEQNCKGSPGPSWTRACMVFKNSEHGKQ